MANPKLSRKQFHPFKETGRADPNRSDSKAPGTPCCPVCRSVSVRGRWQPAPSKLSPLLSSPPRGKVADELKCPACRQLEQRFALGVVEIRGKRWKEKSELVNNTVRNTEKSARSRNDQERVLWIKESVGVTKIYVTLPELARRIGRELEKSFQGVAEYAHSSEESYLRVRWWSDVPHVAHQLGAPLRFKRPSKALSPLQLELAEHRSKAFRGRSRKL